MKQLYTLFLFLSVCLSVQSFAQVQEEKIFSQDIASVILAPLSSDMSLPIMELNSAERLLLRFDELTDESKSYRYKIQHCTAEWQLSDLKLNQYLEGFDDFAITNQKYSFNAIQHYVHYYEQIPNDMTKLKISGNYLLTVYPENDESNPIFTRRFMVKEGSLMGINAVIKISSDVSERTKQQELQVALTPSDNAFIQSPKDYVKVYVQQNGRKDLMRKLTINGIRGNEYTYIWQPENYFPGGNEFRRLDIKNIKIRSRYVDRVEYTNGENHTYLLPEKDKSRLPYETVEDIDGKLKIHADYTDDSDIEGDYTWVHFTVPMSTPRIDGGFYIVGKVTNWDINNESKMEYDQRKGAYFFTKYLKQGYYEYQVLFKRADADVAETSVFENDHAATENEYNIFVYYKAPGMVSDRLIGTATINSRNF